MSIAENLKESPLFRGVELADREALIQVMQRQSYPAGTVLFKKGDSGDAMYIILSGRVAIYTDDAQGQELSSSLTIRSYGPAQMFGEFTMLDQKPRSASAASMSDVELLMLHRDDFMAFLRERPLVGLAMMRNLVERVRYTTTFLQNIMDATQRLTEGAYDEAEDQMPESGTSAEIYQLVEAFVKMLRSIKAREATLKEKSSGPAP